MKENKIFKYAFTATFVLLAILMVVSTKIKSRIDATVIIVLVIAYLPWLSKYIKSLEAFGAKIELLSEEKKEKLQENVNELKKNSSKNTKTNAKTNTKNVKAAVSQSESRKKPLDIEVILEEAYTDEAKEPIERILFMRFELRNNLKEICKQYNIDTEDRSIVGLAYALNDKGIIVKEALDLIQNIVPLMNKIINSDTNAINVDDLNWVIDTGKIIIKYIKNIL